jgi:hypothetical protein
MLPRNPLPSAINFLTLGHGLMVDVLCQLVFLLGRCFVGHVHGFFDGYGGEGTEEMALGLGWRLRHGGRGQWGWTVDGLQARVVGQWFFSVFA